MTHTDAEIEQIIDVLTVKVLNWPGEPAAEDVVATVVADTVMLLDGTLTVADFRRAQP